MAARVGGNRGGQHAGDRCDRAVEREFAEHRVIGKSVRRNGADRGHDAKRDRQIVMAAFLRQIGGREIDGDALGGHGEAGGIERGAHPFAQFGDGLVAKADHREDDVAIGDLHLHVDRARLDALERNRRNSDDHGKPPSFTSRQA